MLTLLWNFCLYLFAKFQHTMSWSFFFAFIFALVSNTCILKVMVCHLISSNQVVHCIHTCTYYTMSIYMYTFPRFHAFIYLSKIILNMSDNSIQVIYGSFESFWEFFLSFSLFISRRLNRRLMKFVQITVGRLPYKLRTKLSGVLADCVRGDLSQSVLTRLNFTESTPVYNLASLEATLLCLMHITAR